MKPRNQENVVEKWMKNPQNKRKEDFVKEEKERKNVVIDVGKREFSSGLTFVACSRVRQIQDLLFIPSVSFQRLASLRNSQRLAERKAEDERFMHM